MSEIDERKQAGTVLEKHSRKQETNDSNYMQIIVCPSCGARICINEGQDTCPKCGARV